MLRIVFMGTPDFAVPTLAAILAAGHEIAAVYSQPPRRADRGMQERRTPVHEFALGKGLSVLTPARLRDAESQSVFAGHKADVAVVVAYGLILPQAVLDAPRLGCLNLHASKLPRWRGAAPIQRAVMAGDGETAVMVMRMEAGLDTGPVCATKITTIGADETAGELHDRLMHAGAALMVEALTALENGTIRCTAQSIDGVTYASKIEKSESRINFARPAADVHNLIRGLSPFPGAWFEVQIGERHERLKVLATTLADGAGTPGTVLDDHLTIACGSNAIRVLKVQRAGKRPMTAQELLRGNPLPPGTVIQAPPERRE